VGPGVAIRLESVMRISLAVEFRFSGENYVFTFFAAAAAVIEAVSQALSDHQQ
jgi:hypothetical protein